MTNPSGSVEAALLHACGAAYNVVAGESLYKPDTVFHRGVGYRHEPRPIVSGPGGINAATVGQTEWGIIVAFRGTLSLSLSDSNSWLDWLNDFMAAPVSEEKGPYQVPGRVHQGFYECTTSLIEELKDQILRLQPSRENPIYITGHSKGGAMATLGAYLLSQNLGVGPIARVVTFASPRVGDATFKTAFERVLQQVRYENAGDIIPLVPPRDEVIARVVDMTQYVPFVGRHLGNFFKKAHGWNYDAVGTIRYITDTTEVVIPKTGNEQSEAIIKGIVEGLWYGDFSTFTKRHGLEIEYGYRRGIGR